ncbi:hypothetical protein PU560_01415, partial [Georgenia sp. 10Sc9-8]|nr:hypothetical protein [Georgenia halotolerans]
ARLSTAAQASDALERTQRLAEVSLPELRHQVDQVVEQTGLRRATTLAEWSEQLRMLDGVRAALDVFTPMVFERSVDDMVTATAGRAWRKERSLTLPASVRRRLRKQAQDLLRPGRPVEDLHAELVRVQEQREIWRRHCQAGGWPRLPDGMAEIGHTERRVRADLEVVQEAVGAGAGNEDLLALPLDDLIDQMRRLGEDPAALRVLPERTRILGELADAGLGA